MAFSSPFVASTVVHLASEEVLGALDTDVSVCLVDVDRVLEALVYFLGEADLLLGHQLVRQTLRLGSLSSFLGLGADDLLC